MTFLIAVRALLRRWGTRLGLIKPRIYERDAKLAEVINEITLGVHANIAYIVAVETKQAMVQILSYMDKNRVPAVGITNEDLGRFLALPLSGALAFMRDQPRMYQVYVIHRGPAAVGWNVPNQFLSSWRSVSPISTFEEREPFRSQFQGRIRRVAR